MYNEKYMRLAIEQAKLALKCEEVPIGAVMVKDDKVIASAFNQKNTANVVSRHAEIIAIEEASKVLGNWRLLDCELYVTLEPCPMCMSAIQQARVKNVYYGIENGDPVNKSIIQMISNRNNTNPKVNLFSGFMQEEILLLLTAFFKKKRNK